MRGRSILRVAACTAILALASANARAQDAPSPTPSPTPTPTPAADGAVETVEITGTRTGPLDPTPMYVDPMIKWKRNKTQAFLGASVEVGFAYARPMLQAGYGKPHYRWVGLEAMPQVSANFGAAYLGWRAAFPFLEVRAGARFVRPFLHVALNAADRHDIRALETENGTPESYHTWEIEALPEVRVGPGFVIGAFTAVAMRGVPRGKHVFEENLRVMAAPPVILRARLGYLFDAKPLARSRIGLAAEVLDVPGRDATVVRAGVLMMWRLHEQVDVLVQLLPVVASPDTLGLSGADFNQLGVRYRWATPDVPGPAER